MNLPNKLTVARCVMSLFFVAVMSVENVFAYMLAYVIFILAAITDYYDGKIARERNLITNFGKLLDPVADKVLMLAAFIMLMTLPALRIPGWTLVVIFSREFVVTGFRSLAASQGLVLAASRWGKAKTVLQMAYVIIFMFLAIILEYMESYSTWAQAQELPVEAYASYLGLYSLIAIILVAFYTVCSGIAFARVNWKALGLDQTQ